MEIRSLDLDRDAPGVVAVVHDVRPYTTTTIDAWVQSERAVPERAQQASWVAVDDGEVVAFAQASLKWFASNNSAFGGVSVRASHRGQGLGTELWDRAETHLLGLGPERVGTMFTENEAGVAFARARGFVEERAETLSRVDPSTVAPPDGDVVPLRELDPRVVYDVDMTTTPDVPQSDPVDDLPYAEWLDLIWRRPTLTLDGSFGALVDGQLACITLLAVNLDVRRGFNEYTATQRDFRGRGLADRVKRASLAWAAEQGITAVWTTNDETNAAMLSVNARLGYEPAARRVEYVRTGTTTSAPASPTT